MNPDIFRKTITVAALLLLITVIGRGRYADSSAQADATADRESLDVRDAKICLELAQLRLDAALEKNQSAPITYRPELIERLRQRVKVMEEQLRQAELGSDADFHQIHIRDAEAEVAVAEAEVKEAEQLHRRLPSRVTDRDLRDLRLSLELAKVRLEKARRASRSESRIAHMERDLQQLREQVLELQVWRDAHSTRP